MKALYKALSFPGVRTMVERDTVGTGEQRNAGENDKKARVREL